MNLPIKGGVQALIYHEDENIVIRDIIEEDIVSLFTWWVDKEINKYDPKPIPTNCVELVRECESYCQRFETEVITSDYSKRKYKYFIVCNKDGQPIGFVNLFSFDAENKQCEMGVEIGDKRYWRKGIAEKAIQIVIGYLFSKTDIRRVYIETGETNAPALSLFKKLNFIKCDEIMDEGFKFIMMELVKK